MGQNSQKMKCGACGMFDNEAEVEDDVASLFDHYLNLCPKQGSRTIRTEEALLVGLAALKPHLEAAGEAGQAAAV